MPDLWHSLPWWSNSFCKKPRNCRLLAFNGFTWWRRILTPVAYSTGPEHFTQRILQNQCAFLCVLLRHLCLESGLRITLPSDGIWALSKSWIIQHHKSQHWRHNTDNLGGRNLSNCRSSEKNQGIHFYAITLFFKMLIDKIFIWTTCWNGIHRITSGYTAAWRNSRWSDCDSAYSTCLLPTGSASY